MLSHPAHLLALGFGSGLAWILPGTFGTLMGWLLYLWIDPLLSGNQWVWLIAGAFIVGAVCCHITGKALGVIDHGGIVWDEIVAIWLVLFVASSQFSSPLGQLVCVVVFRFFDMVKPPPIRWFDRHWKNGFGVMFDDIVAAFITLLALAIYIHAFD
jgi:phosphatidylglycerophosphatase A